MSRTQRRAQERRPEGQGQTTAIVPFDAKKKATELVTAIEARRDQIASFLQVRDDREYDRFVNVAVDAIVRDTNLLSADLLSLVASIRHAAIMGLEPSSVMGEGAIVVYRDSSQGKKIAQFQPMVRGLAKLARNSGEVRSIGVDVVHRNDVFDIDSGSEPKITHKPTTTGDQGDVIGAYAFVKLRSGELVPLYMTTDEILKRRRISKSFQNSGDESIWGKWPEEMMKKTVLRRLLIEKVPLSFRASQALALDAEIDSAQGDPEKVEATVSRTTRRLLAHVDEVDGSQNGAGAEKKPEGGSGATDKANEAQRGSGEPVEGQAKVLCGAGSDLADVRGPCVREAHGDDVTHRNEAGETWRKVPGDSRDG